MKPLVVLGSINLDLVLHVDHIPAVGETLLATGHDEFLGGKGANQAVAAARLGNAVHFIGRVGEDAYAQRLRTGLEAAGVDTSALTSAPTPSGLAVILHARDGANSIVVQPGANAALQPEDVQQHTSLLQEAAVLLLQLETPLATVLAAARMADAAGTLVMLDPAPARTLPSELLHSTTWLTPNEIEAQTLCGLPLDDPAEVAAHLLEMGARNVALKLGERGAFLAGRDCEPTLIPAFPVNAVDTTAAGDCFNAAFATRLTAGEAPAEAARYANAAAALCVTRAGAQAAMPTAAEVGTFLAEHARNATSASPRG